MSAAAKLQRAQAAEAGGRNAGKESSLAAKTGQPGAWPREKVLSWLVGLWLVGVMILSNRLLLGWASVQRLKRNQLGVLDPSWREKLSALKRGLGLRRMVGLFQSALVEVPTVVGWLRPVILLPASSLTGLTTGQLEAILAHELAHTCAVWHHGDTDTKETWQNVFIIENGVVRSVIRENGQDLKLRLEGDTPVTDFFAISDMYIGVFGGQHSGDEDCFMRYYCAQAFRSRFDDHVRYMVGGLFSTIPESPGIHLCTSTNGTGINKAQNPSVPWRPRYGDAGPNRGNCKSQICVNDLFMDPSYHQR